VFIIKRRSIGDALRDKFLRLGEKGKQLHRDTDNDIIRRDWMTLIYIYMAIKELPEKIKGRLVYSLRSSNKPAFSPLDRGTVEPTAFFEGIG